MISDVTVLDTDSHIAAMVGRIRRGLARLLHHERHAPPSGNQPHDRGLLLGMGVCVGCTVLAVQPVTGQICDHFVDMY
jgi:hypothetical protein